MLDGAITTLRVIFSEGGYAKPAAGVTAAGAKNADDDCEPIPKFPRFAPCVVAPGTNDAKLIIF